MKPSLPASGRLFPVPVHLSFDGERFMAGLKEFLEAGLWIRIHFLRIRIRIQWIRMEANTDPDPDRIRIQGFNDQKLKEKKQLKKKIKFFFDQKLQFTYP
jgi:hypothetical protein